MDSGTSAQTLSTTQAEAAALFPEFSKFLDP